KATDSVYRRQVHTTMRASYRNHYRRMVPEILGALQFRSNNATHQPVIRALDLLKKYAESSLHYYPAGETVPIAGVVRSIWEKIVLEQDQEGAERINRINYELCVLEMLGEKLRCKEIWVVGASRFRNPEEDLPADFA